mgnify:CR=1 FL=1
MIYANIVERVKELNNDAWLSLVERCVRDAEVAGSNPVASTKKTGTLLGVLVFYIKISTPILSGIILPCYNERKQVNI